jgi:hypothetical protein
VRAIAIAIAIAAAAIAALAACGDDTDCGPGDAPASGITVATPDGAITYGAFTSSPNNDCTPADGQLTSLTVDGVQQQPTPVGMFTPHLALCITRPERTGADPVPFGLTDDDPINLVSVNAEAGGCTFALDRSTAPEATATFTGYCADGSDPAGYAIELAGSVTLARTCGADIDTVTVELGGAAAVEAAAP